MHKPLPREVQDAIYAEYLRGVDTKEIAKQFGIRWMYCLAIIRKVRMGRASNEPVDFETFKSMRTESVARRAGTKGAVQARSVSQPTPEPRPRPKPRPAPRATPTGKPFSMLSGTRLPVPPPRPHTFADDDEPGLADA